MDGGVLDGLGRFKIRLSAVEGVDGQAGLAQLQHLVADLHDIGKTDFVEAFCCAQAAECHKGEPFAPRC